MMRVISGSLRRRLLKEVPSDNTRSTKDRVKESMFNMLMPLERFEQCLDVFAGSGALGIEALSRGVAKAVFIEQDAKAFAVLKENINNLELQKKSVIVRQDALSYLNTLNERYDLIIIDPPYHSNLVNQSIEAVVMKKLLHSDGVMVSLSHKEDIIHLPQGLIDTKRRVVGITVVTFYEWSD